MKVQFTVDAKKYFEADADRFFAASDDDLVIVTIDFNRRRADYIWFNAGENPANHPTVEDDFDGVVALWEELGRPSI